MLYTTMLRKSRRSTLWLALCGALTLWSSARMVAQTCTGDCNGDQEVSVDEIIEGASINLGLADLSVCPAMDNNNDLEVTVDELGTAAASALNGCPIGTPTPTATPTQTMTTGNRPPAAGDDAAATLVGESIPIVVLANDTDPDNDPLHVTGFTQPAKGTVSFAGDVATYTPNGAVTGNDRFTYMISDGHGGTASATVTVVVNSLPPDPADVAPPPATGVATVVAGATSFLYTGGNAVQFGVVPGIVAPIQAAVVRGTVKTRAGNPLPGVRITVLGHPEFGFTASRADGMFDIAVNGGGMLTINYEKPGFCPVQRAINVPWQDYVRAPEVMMTPLDPAVTNVAFGANSAFQVAQSSMQADADGTRHTLIVFHPGTTAALLLAGGATQDVSSLHIRATEFTVGTNGPAAMPALLPPMVGYTYCVELSADEAMSAGATGVVFNQPVITYVENFLGFPVGTGVPVGIYDRQNAVWMPSPNGRVVKIVSLTGGLADVDTDGDNVADNGLGITTEERQALASVYSAGQSLWRVPVTHFSPEDSNWPYTIPPDAESPGDNGAGPDANDPLENACESDGTIIECENQVLGDAVPIVGTPYTLNYRSDRVPDRVATRSIQLSGPSVPVSLASISLHLSVAGRNFDQDFPASPNQQTTFVWDKLDAYGRPVIGGQTLSGTIDYNYPTMYTEPGPLPSGFNSAGGTTLTANPTRQQISISQHFSTMIGEGLTDARTIGLGGWMLNVHYVFDPQARVMHGGNGSRRRAGSLARILTTIDVPGQSILFDVAVGPDGSQYVALPHGDLIVRVAPDGTERIVAGNGTEGFNGDGIPATSAELGDPAGIAVGPDGNLYIAEESNNRIRRVSRDGMISTVAGTGAPGFGGDGGLATAAQLTFPTRVAVGTDSTIYFVDGLSRVRRVTPDGIISTVAGNGSRSFSGDNGPATTAGLNNAFGVAVAPDGSFYIADRSNNRVRRVGPDGIIRTVADYTSQSGLPMAVAMTSDGSVLIGVQFNSARTPQVDLLKPDGSIVTVAGGGSSDIQEGIPATQANLVSVVGVAAAPDGSVFVAPGNSGSRLFRIGPALPGFEGSANLIASADGNELYVFDAQGRHERTLNALTGATVLEFDYDSHGLLSHVIEKTGGTDNVTTIQHDGAGNPTAIIGPFGQLTTLTVDANGFLASISNPAGDAVQMTSSAGGLLATYTDPRGKTSAFSYDSFGRLTLDAEPAGASQTLARATATTEFTVTRTTALGRATTYRTENLSGNIQRRTVTAPDSTQNQSTDTMDAGTTHATTSDGTISDTALGPDPRFGMESPVTKSFSLQLPSALQLTATTTRSATLANPADPLSLVGLTESRTVDGRTISSTYTAATRTFATTLPSGRTRTLVFDTLGRLAQSQIAGLDPVNVAYDSRGRLASVSTGSGSNARTFSIAYNTQGFADTFTDPVGRTVHLAYDTAGRITTNTLPDGSEVSRDYDAAGNLTNLAPPGRPAYAFGYSDRNELTMVTPPVVPGTGPTKYNYDADGAITHIDRAGFHTVTVNYDAAGRPASRVLTSGANPPTTDTFNYDSVGRISSVVTASGESISYSYDGALTTDETLSGPVSGKVTRTYDTGLRMTSQSVNGTNTVAYSYDDDGQLLSVGSMSIDRSPQHGLITNTTLGVVAASLSYNSIGEQTDYTAAVNGTPFFDLKYSRDGLGRITQKAETVGGVTDTFAYTYDLAGQLIAVTKNGTLIESYSYDSNGNRTSATVDGVTLNATYDDQDRLTQYGSTLFAYTPDGDLLSKTNGAQTTTYDYDALGNLRGVTLPDGTAVTYVIDGRNRRVGKRINGTLVQGWLYGDALRPVAELDGSGTLVSRFIYAKRTVPVALIRAGIAHRIVTDDAGSVRLVVNSATGAIVQHIDYDAFGNATRDTNPGFQPFGFAGGLYDPDTKLLRSGARDYDAGTGHWTAKDPVGFVGRDTNLYRYVRNDPVNLTDPFGTADTPTDLDLIRYLKDVIDNAKAGIDNGSRRLLELGIRGENQLLAAEGEAGAIVDQVLAQRELLRQAQQELKNLRAVANQKSLVPFTGKINCSGALGGALNLLSLSDFINLGIEALQTDENFFDLMDAQAQRERADFRERGVHTTVGFILGVPLVIEDQQM